MVTSLIPSFNAGELSPLIHLRSDLEKYRSGCRTLENFLITPYGGVRRRPGLEYIAATKGNGVARMVRFQYSISDSFMLEFSHLTMRVFKNGLPVMDALVPYEITTPYPAANLFQFQVIQINNIARLVHPLFPPQHLVRNADDDWTLEPVDFTYPPFLDENLNDDLTITTSGAAVPGASVDLESSLPLFEAGHVGAFFEISKERLLTDYEVSLRAKSENDGVHSENIVIQGRWGFNTFGSWDGTFFIERSQDDGGTWEDIRSYESDLDRNVSAEGEEPSRVLMRIRWEHVGTGSSAPRGVLSSPDGVIKGWVKITAVTDSTHATATAGTYIEEVTTKYWSEGAWSTKQGFPRAVTAHEQRVVYGGTEGRSQTLWGSVIDDYDNFRRGTNDDDSWAHSLAADQQNSIQSLLSQKQLLVLTSGAEWVLASSKEETPITPTNVRARRHSGHGSEYLPATLINDVAIFIQRGSRKIREMAFSFEQDGYITQDLTMLAEHVTEGGIIQTAYQAQRDSILWCVTGRGQLIGLTYEKGQNVIGWHRHVTGNPATDGFESVAVLATEGEEDEVWVVVRRVIGGVTKRFVERFRPDQFRAQASNDLDDLFFVDSGKITVGTNLTEVTGLGHLEGQTVQILADGAVLNPRVVTGGKIELTDPTDPESADSFSIGLQYDSLLEPMPLELGMQNGTSVSRNKKIHELVIYFDKSSQAKVSDRKSGPFDTLPFRDTEMVPDAPPLLFSGAYQHMLDSRHRLDASFVIKQDAPLPMTVLAVVPKYNVYGDND